MVNEIEVWGIGTPRCMRVHWMLEELGLDFKIHPIRSRTGEANTEEYRRLNPREKIPTLVHGSFALTESAAIVTYLGDSFSVPDTFFVPKTVKEIALVDEWNYMIMTELDATSLYIIRRHESLKHLYCPSPEVVESAKEYFSKQIEAMKSAANLKGSYLCGDKCSSADIMMITTLDWALKCGINLSEEWNLYRDRVIMRAAYKRAFEINYPDGMKV